jgi:hypothetical protein
MDTGTRIKQPACVHVCASALARSGVECACMRSCHLFFLFVISANASIETLQLVTCKATDPGPWPKDSFEASAVGKPAASAAGE